MSYEKQNKVYTYNHNDSFSDFMNTDIFRVLIKELRKDACSFAVERDIEPVYIFGEFAGIDYRGSTFFINNELVDGIPDYAINGIVRYYNKYILPYKKIW